MASLEFNSVGLLRIAWSASAAAATDQICRGPSALPQDALVAIVFSAAAVEAFTNDLAAHVDAWRKATAWDQAQWDSAPWAFNPTTPELIRAVADMLDIESKRQPDQLAAKVRAATRALANDPSRHDGTEIQELGRLIVLREAIMHARDSERSARPALAEVLRELDKHGLTVATYGIHAAAFLKMESPRLAAWAYRIAYRIIHAMLKLVPQDVESVQSLREVLSNSVKIPLPREPAPASTQPA